jgi:hypothetical protein
MMMLLLLAPSCKTLQYMRRGGVVVIVVVAIALQTMPSQKLTIFCIPAGYNRAPYALETDAIRDITDVGIQYRVRT